ncbi:protein phosphatase 1 regulatory subunit 1C isoform X3 [Brachyhypopomus gauderio]|uniref:protein phosphatase 1 regulatory subunit 1C isoform X3 n=1 Tax=Brachyhypopomus gauderio TaxID=698409 RepID=UPI00404332FF
MEPNSPKKIQFAVPSFQSHLDPQAAEHIRKRRPTPATLVIYNDPSPSDEKQSASSQGEVAPGSTQGEVAPGSTQGETRSAQLSPAQRKTSVYTPPTMRGREPAKIQRAGPEESLHRPRRPQSPLATLSEESAHVPPRRKDTPYQQQPPFTAGMKTGKDQTESSSAFLEDEEDLP